MLSYQKLIKNNKIFIRPSNGSKTFTGQILTKSNFSDQYDTLVKSYGGIDMGTLVLVAPVKEIGEEWRFIVKVVKTINELCIKEWKDIYEF